MSDIELEKVRGSCHCGAVSYEAILPTKVVAHRCNCSICEKTGFVHVIVPGDRFVLLEGEEALRTYRFNSKIARHLFCGTCGVKSYYVPRSNPDGFSLNLACLDLPETVSVTVEPFDGQNWEREAVRLSALSKPG